MEGGKKNIKIITDEKIRFTVDKVGNCEETIICRPVRLQQTQPVYITVYQSNVATQTDEIVGCLNEEKEQSQIEKDLLERVRSLEESLKLQTDLLLEIQATAARQIGNVEQQKQQPQKLQHQMQQQKNQYQTKDQENCTITGTTTSPKPSAPKRNLNASAAMNTAVPQAPTGSIKYTIIAEAGGETNGEPIEIELTEANNSLSESISGMNVCLLDEEEVHLKVLKTPSSSIKMENARECSSADSLSSTDVEEQSNSDATPARGRGRGRKPTSGRGLKKSKKNQISETTFKSKLDMSKVMVSIGPNDTLVPASVYDEINWDSPTLSTRQLLCSVFDRHTLATHSMTGKSSPAFLDKPRKNGLNPRAIEDIIFAVTNKCNVSKKTVRNSITTKCADENKMMKQKEKGKPNKKKQQNANKEN